MKVKTLRIILICVFLVLMCPLASATVSTTDHTEGMGNCVYVAGDADFYPVEFYNDKTGKYEGVIPELLEKISESSGVNFVYINGNKEEKSKLAENLQVEIVSAYNEEEKAPYAKDYVELIAYEKDGKVEKVGVAFTEIAGQSLKDTLRFEAENLTDETKNGILLKYSLERPVDNTGLIIAIILCCVFFAAMLTLLILQIKRVKRQNKKDRLTDPETGMGNLAYFKHHFENSIDQVSRTLYYVSYIILDSNYLRSYHGGTTFDEVLKYTASVLNEHTADSEIAARITESGFVYAFRSMNDGDAKKRLEEIIKKLNNFADIKERNNKVVFHAAVYNLNAGDRNSEILLFNLRKNCNKIFGTEQQIIFCDVHSMNKVQEEKKIVEGILKGLENEEFKIYAQFIVDNKTKKPVSAEALSRWDNPRQGLLGPGKYIEAMESADLISKHDFYMFEMVCKELERWKSTDLGNISMSCNFTRITLSESNFVDRLKDISDRYSFEKKRLVIEITEDAIEKNMEIAMNNVSKCKELGFHIALDDLGSGYTSLANLCDYPIDVVKIDRDILLKTDSEKGRDLFNGIIALAHSLNLKVVCEGVETKEHEELVTQSDCDYVQGWYYSKAIPVQECESFLKEYSQRRLNK